MKTVMNPDGVTHTVNDDHWSVTDPTYTIIDTPTTPKNPESKQPERKPKRRPGRPRKTT